MNMQPDVIGKIYEEYPEYDEEGNLVSEGILADGYHVNFPSEVEEFREYRVYPKTPMRVYAGGVEPVCYSFESKEQWEEKREEAFGIEEVQTEEGNE